MAFVIKTHINSDKIAQKYVSPALKVYANTRLYALCDDYVPFLDGLLSSNVRISEEYVEYLEPYARYQYTGQGFNFTKDYHPLATAEWDKAAMTAKKDTLIKDIENAIKHGSNFMQAYTSQTENEIAKRKSESEKRRKERSNGSE